MWERKRERARAQAGARAREIQRTEIPKRGAPVRGAPPTHTSNRRRLQLVTHKRRVCMKKEWASVRDAQETCMYEKRPNKQAYQFVGRY